MSFRKSDGLSTIQLAYPSLTTSLILSVVCGRKADGVLKAVNDHKQPSNIVRMN